MIYRIIDDFGQIYGEEEDYGNAAELQMVLEEWHEKVLTIVEVNTDV